MHTHFAAGKGFAAGKVLWKAITYLSATLEYWWMNIVNDFSVLVKISKLIYKPFLYMPKIGKCGMKLCLNQVIMISPFNIFISFLRSLIVQQVLM